MAFGASLAEGAYAMLAYFVFFKLVGNSKILNYIMPLLKLVIFMFSFIRVLAAVIIMNVGCSFTKVTTSTFEATNSSPSEFVIFNLFFKFLERKKCNS